MTQTDCAIVDALLDGEPVEKARLREALGHAEARDYFIDGLLLKRLALDMGPRVFPAADRPAAPTMRVIRWVMAAAAAVAIATGGYLIGRGQPVLPSPAAVRLADSVSAPARPPVPTQTIRFERGKNWISDLGN
jgi:hypothetical protein